MKPVVIGLRTESPQLDIEVDKVHREGTNEHECQSVAHVFHLPLGMSDFHSLLHSTLDNLLLLLSQIPRIW